MKRGFTLLAVLLCSATRPAWAGAPVPALTDAVATEPARPHIAHGQPAEPCAWPTVVSVEGASQCSGTLVHPRVILYAAHCGGGSKTVRFGEQSLAGGRSVVAERCVVYPDYGGDQDQGRDWAYCLLAEPAGLPVTPPLFGCEGLALEVGVDVAIAGFGETEDGEFGVKRWATTPLAALTPANNTALVGNPMQPETPSLCSGDSGGPGFVRLADGSWRTFGIASTSVGECGGYGAYALVPAAMAWVEAEVELDLTPCYAADGSWAPGPACSGANAAQPGVGVGSWEDWCSGTAAAGAATSCGLAWDAFDASLLPSVEVLSPSADEMLGLGPVSVEVSASKDPAGFAVARVGLELDGVALELEDLLEPWAFELEPEPGAHQLVAIAEDWAGNEVRSVSVGFWVGPGGNSEESGDESSDEGTESEGGACNCAAQPPGVPWLGLSVFACLGFVGFARTRKRRPAQ